MSENDGKRLVFKVFAEKFTFLYKQKIFQNLRKELQF